MRYRLVQQWQEKAVPVTQACRLLEVSRAGYYQRRQRPARVADVATTVQLKAASAVSGKSYGSRRLRMALAHEGFRWVAGECVDLCEKAACTRCGSESL